jgi:hypothetical protein
MSKREKKRTFNEGDRVMVIGTVTCKRGGGEHYEVRIDNDYDIDTCFLGTALHPHTVRATPEARPKASASEALKMLNFAMPRMTKGERRTIALFVKDAIAVYDGTPKVAKKKARKK